MLISQYVAVGSKMHIVHKVHPANVSISSHTVLQQHRNSTLHGGDLNRLMSPRSRESTCLCERFSHPITCLVEHFDARNKFSLILA